MAARPMNPLRERIRFECPWCGASAFGSMVVKEGEPRGLCYGHDSLGRPCKFTWNRTEDYRWFVRVEHFDTPTELEAAMFQEREILQKVLDRAAESPEGKKDAP